MTIGELRAATDAGALGRELHDLAADLYPLCRSITGDGLRETLRRVSKRAGLTLHEVPTGTPVLDWTVPREWNIRDAWVKNARGERVIDFRASTLHVVGYSVPVRRTMTLAQLRPHLHTLPEHPDWIPFRTAYYHETWGFCLRHRDLEAMDEGPYEVVIDATLADGHLTYGEAILPGDTPDEVLISCHACHPSLANDNLSGVAVATALAERLQEVEHRCTYRFVFVPGTIGSITWLARNQDRLDRIRHGLVLTGLGDRGPLTYKRSRRGDAPVDRAAAHVLRHAGPGHRVRDFVPWGYDERQYCSPGFDLPVGVLSRTPHGEYPEYHTSADDLAFVTPEALGEAFVTVLAILETLEGDGRYRNLSPRGEPQLGRRGLYRAIGGQAGDRREELALLWVLNLSDGRHSLLDIAERSGLPFPTIRRAAEALLAAELLAPAGEEG